MTVKHRTNSKYNWKRRRNLCLTTAVVWAVSSFNESTLPQIAHAFTTSTSPLSAASSIYKCHNGVGKRILSLYHHGTSPSSSSSPLPPYIFDSNQLQMQLLPLEDSASLQNSNLEHGPDLMDALNGLNMPLQQDIMQDNKEFKFSDDNREFELKLGKAMDTLRKDYPEMLKSAPDFSIYHDEIETVDPSGFKLHTLSKYKKSFQFLHGMLNFFYDPSLSLLTFRLIYDCARKDIRVSWNAYLVPRPIYGGEGNALHLDGISVYVLNRVSGLITQHRVERLLLNDVPVQAPQEIFEAMRNAVGAEEGTEGVPVWNMDLDMEGERRSAPGQFNLEFRRHAGLLAGVPSKSTLFSEDETSSSSEDSGTSSTTMTTLFSSSSDGIEEAASAPDSADNHHVSQFFDQVAFERKNASLKKFGLKPITPDEYIKNEVKVEEIASVQREKLADALAAAQLTKPKPKTNLFGNLFGGILRDTCESNWDCERPEVCCDLGFKKMCCSSGMKVFDGVPQMQQVPVFVETADDGGLSRGGPDTNIL